MDKEFELAVPQYQHIVPGTVGRSRQLADFEYPGTFGLSEERLKAVVACFLRGAGYTVEVGRKGASGPDLVAESDSDRIILEVKGEGRNRRAIYRSVMVVLGQILRRMQNEDSRFVVALPAQEGFVRLARTLPAFLRQKLNLEIWVINPDNVGYMLAILPHNVA